MNAKLTFFLGAIVIALSTSHADAQIWQFRVSGIHGESQFGTSAFPVQDGRMVNGPKLLSATPYPLPVVRRRIVPDFRAPYLPTGQRITPTEELYGAYHFLLE